MFHCFFKLLKTDLPITILHYHTLTSSTFSIVLLTNCSNWRFVKLVPTIVFRASYSSSLEMYPSSSKSYILNANKSFFSFELPQISWRPELFMINHRWTLWKISYHPCHDRILKTLFEQVDSHGVKGCVESSSGQENHCYQDRDAWIEIVDELRFDDEIKGRGSGASFPSIFRIEV